MREGVWVEGKESMRHDTNMAGMATCNKQQAL